MERGFDVDEFRADPGLIATETDPSTRLTLSKRLRPDVELILSQSLRESGGLTAVISYKPRRNIELRAVSRDNLDRSFALRHEITFGGRGNAVNASEGGPQVANITISGLFAGTPGLGGTGGLGDVQQPFVDRRNEVLHVSDDVTWVRGRHSLKFGAELQRQRMFIAFVNRPNGDFTFNGVHSANPIADFLLGLPSQFRRTTANTSQDGHGWIYGGYAQDEFRLGNVTLSAGLRYEVAVPFVDANDIADVASVVINSCHEPSPTSGGPSGRPSLRESGSMM